MTGREIQIPGDPTIHDRLAEEIRKAERDVDLAGKQLKHDTEKAAKELAAYEALKKQIAGIKSPAPFLTKELDESNRRASEAVNAKKRLQQNLKAAEKNLAQFQLAKEQLGKPKN